MSDEARPMNERAMNEREAVEMLLPWYVTGRLEAAERTQVETWLARDAAMVRQLALIAEDSAATRLANDRIATPRTMTVQGALDRVTGARRPRSTARAHVAAVLRDFFAAPTAGAVRWAAAAAAAVLLLQALAIGGLIGTRQAPDHEVAADDAAARRPGAFALVRFADTATATAIADVLTRLDMSIVAGPKPGGMYRVRIGDATLPAADREARYAALRKETAVVSIVLQAPVLQSP